jgi:hypothetical protein
MTADALFRTLELAVVCRQASRIAIASTEIGVSNSWLQFNESIYASSEVAALSIKAADPGSQWSPIEEVRVTTIINNLVNIWLTVETACANEIATRATCDEIEDEIRFVIDVMPAAHEQWRTVIGRYPSMAESQVFETINSALSDEGS